MAVHAEDLIDDKPLGILIGENDCADEDQPYEKIFSNRGILLHKRPSYRA
jgi:hypothetical protein